VVVQAELPGLKKENVKVANTGDLLEIEGERKLGTEEKRNGYVHLERQHGKFYRALALPEGANGEKPRRSLPMAYFEIAVPVPEVMRATREIPVGDVKAKAEVKH
jgi:HSP20 family protein